jgi:hypothetical protein
MRGWRIDGGGGIGYTVDRFGDLNNFSTYSISRKGNDNPYLVYL